MTAAADGGACADATIAGFIARLSARTATPGGGAAAALAAALGCAAGAMAARYTTGAKWGALSAQAESLALALDIASAACLVLADADAAAYAAVRSARATGDAAAVDRAERSAAAVPGDLLAACARTAAALHDFLPRCNPQLVSDVAVGIHLLAGAGRAAWQTLLVNHPGAAVQAIARTHLDRLGQADAAALTAAPAG